MNAAAVAVCAALALWLSTLSCRREELPLDRLGDTGYRELEQGKLQHALATAERGLASARAHGSPAWERSFRILKAEVLVGERRHADALALLDPELASSGSADLAQARALMSRGYALCQSSEVPDSAARAAHDFERAVAVARTMGSNHLLAEVALRRGSCHLLREAWAAAESEFRRTLDLARSEKLGLLEAHAAGSLGLLRIRMARYDDGVEWLRRAQDVAARLDSDIARVKIMINLGWGYYLLGDYARARSLLTPALDLATANGLAGDRQLALNNLGNTSFREGRYAEASEHYRRSLAIARELRRPSDVAVFLVNLAAAELELGQHDAAAAHVREALPIMDELRDAAGRQLCLFTEGDIWATRGQFHEAEARYRNIIESPDTPANMLWEVRGALAALHVRAGHVQEAEAEYARAFTAMDKMRASLREAESRITFFSSLRRFYDAYVDFLVTRGEIERALLVADDSRGRTLRDRLGPGRRPAVTGRPPFPQLARGLKVVLLSYWLGPQRSFLWVVTPAGVRLHVLPDAVTLRRDVEMYQATLLQARDVVAEATPEGTRLWQHLVAPAVDVLPSETRVVIVPDGPLWLLNFETLLAPGPPLHYWIHDVTIAEAPALWFLIDADADAVRRRAPQQLLMIGDPVPANDDFPRLPHALPEVRQIAGLFARDEITVYSGAAAEPAAYRRARPQSFNFIHFASHATTNKDSPLDSSIVLSPSGDGYKLYARDVLDLRLRADLVSLSGCRGAGSTTFAGEGLVGFAWAFLSAGANSVIGGLWNVEDASTSRLMENLYRNIQEGRDPTAALRHAKLSFVTSSTSYRKPLYWAPFVAYTRHPLRRGPG